MSDNAIKELKNLRVTYVSYVTKGANKKKFFLVKSDDKQENETDFEMNVRIIKSDLSEAKRLVYGVVAEPNSVDTQNHTVSSDEIEKAAHNFLANFRRIDEMHDFVEGAGTLVESFITLTDMDMNGETIKAGSWVIVTKATDEIFAKIVDGTYTGYSLAGLAILEEPLGKINDNETSQANDVEIVKGIFNKALESQQDDFYGNTMMLINSAYNVIYSDRTDDEKKALVLEGVDEFRNKIASISVLKSDEKAVIENDVEPVTATENVEIANASKENQQTLKAEDDDKILDEKISASNDELLEKFNEVIERFKDEMINKFEENSVSDVQNVVSTRINKKKKLTKTEELATIIA